MVGKRYSMIPAEADTYGVVEAHTIDDFAFVAKSGEWVPILLPGVHIPYGYMQPAVWCRRHGWEEFDELVQESEDYVGRHM